MHNKGASPFACWSSLSSIHPTHTQTKCAQCVVFVVVSVVCGVNDEDTLHTLSSKIVTRRILQRMCAGASETKRCALTASVSTALARTNKQDDADDFRSIIKVGDDDLSFYAFSLLCVKWRIKAYSGGALNGGGGAFLCSRRRDNK